MCRFSNKDKRITRHKSTKEKYDSWVADPQLWKEVKKTAIDLGMTTTRFFEEALKEKLAKHKNNKSKA